MPISHFGIDVGSVHFTDIDYAFCAEKFCHLAREEGGNYSHCVLARPVLDFLINIDNNNRKLLFFNAGCVD